MRVHFIGAGPGAADLITVRGLDLIRRSPVILYAGSLVPLEVVAEAFRRISVADFVAQYEAARAAYKPTSRAEIQARAAARKA